MINLYLNHTFISDKRAFFLVSISEVGPQIYEFITPNKDEKNKSDFDIEKEFIKFNIQLLLFKMMFSYTLNLS